VRLVRDLVRLLDGVRHDRRRRLLAVPRALAAQTLRQQLQLEEGFPRPASHSAGRGRRRNRRSSRCRRRVARLVRDLAAVVLLHLAEPVSLEYCFASFAKLWPLFSFPSI